LPLEREFGWSRSQLTSVYSIYLLVHGFTSPLVGLLFDRLGPRWVYATGMACLGAAFLLAGELVSLWQFYLFIGALVGLGVRPERHGAGLGAARALVPRRLSSAIGIAFSAVGVGTIRVRAARAIPGGALRLAVRISLSGDRRSRARPHRRLRSAVEAVLRGAPPRREAARQPRKGWTLRAALRSPLYWVFARCSSATAAAMFSVIVAAGRLLRRRGLLAHRRRDCLRHARMMSALSVMGSGLLSERFGYRQTVTATFVGTAAGMSILFALTFVPSTFLLALFVPAFGLCMGVRGPIVSSVSTKYFAGPNVGDHLRLDLCVERARPPRSAR